MRTDALAHARPVILGNAYPRPAQHGPDAGAAASGWTSISAPSASKATTSSGRCPAPCRTEPIHGAKKGVRRMPHRGGRAVLEAADDLVLAERRGSRDHRSRLGNRDEAHRRGAELPRLAARRDVLGAGGGGAATCEPGPGTAKADPANGPVSFVAEVCVARRRGSAVLPPSPDPWLVGGG